MRWAILLAIRAYWLLIPNAWKRRCLYRVSCSRHVYGVARTHGAAAGWAAFIQRFRTCRPGYAFVVDMNGVYGRMCDHSWVATSDVSSALLD